jgi:hypothetical protein
MTKAGDWFGNAKPEPTEAMDMLEGAAPAEAAAPAPTQRTRTVKPKPEPAPAEVIETAPQATPEPVKEAPNNEPATDTDDGDVFG